MKFTVGVIASVGVLVGLILLSIVNSPGMLPGVVEKIREPFHGGITPVKENNELPVPSTTPEVPVTTPEVPVTTPETPTPIEEPSPKVEPKACTMEYMPVCGVDGITYGNKCMLDAQGTKLDYEGECKKPETPVGMMPVASKTVQVTIAEGASTFGCEETNNCYLPYSVTINQGDTVEWKNTDTAAHTVTSGSPENGTDGLFDSSLFMSGTSFSFTFDTEGTFPYFCMVHPWMQGKVIVEKRFSEVNVSEQPPTVEEHNPSVETSTKTTVEPTSTPEVNGTTSKIQESGSINHEIIIPEGAMTPSCTSENKCYIPSSLEVKIGDTVTWNNTDSGAHFATSGDPNTGADGKFDSGMIGPGQTFDFTFTKSGEYPYYCTAHPWMKGSITVS